VELRDRHSHYSNTSSALLHLLMTTSIFTSTPHYQSTCVAKRACSKRGVLTSGFFGLARITGERVMLSGFHSVTVKGGSEDSAGAIRSEQIMGDNSLPSCSALPSSKACGHTLSRKPSDAKESAAGIRARVAPRLPHQPAAPADRASAR